MSSVGKNIAVLFVMAVYLIYWPAAARAQGCFISGHGDYICGPGGGAGRENAGPAQRPDARPSMRPTPPAVPPPARPSMRPLLADAPRANPATFVNGDLFRRCTDGRDNDRDSVIDARDPDCAAVYNNPALKRLAGVVNPVPPSAPAQQHPPPLTCTDIPVLPVTEGDNIVRVSSDGALRAALSTAKPGDVILLANGSYSGDFTLSTSGTANKPVIIQAENPGKVAFRNTHFNLDGNHALLTGFVFEQRAQVTVTGNHNRISRNIFRNSRRQGKVFESAVQLEDAASFNRVDHNEITNWCAYGLRLTSTSAGMTSNRLDHNYLHDSPPDCVPGRHPAYGEPIQIGSGMHDAAHTLKTLVEYNLVDNFRTDEDGELVSVKSSGNLIQANTFKNTDDALVLRQGSNNTVKNNTLINIPSVQSAGIGHQIIGNRLINTDLHVADGDCTDGANGCHAAARNQLVGGNILEGGSIFVGKSYTSGVAAQNNVLCQNQGAVRTAGNGLHHTGTKITTACAGPIGTPVLMGPHQVGPGAPGDGVQGGTVRAGACAELPHREDARPPRPTTPAPSQQQPPAGGAAVPPPSPPSGGFTAPACNATVPGTSYYAAPNGAGSVCTGSAPCSLDAALAKAGPGDEVVLKDGVYRQQVQPARSGASGRPIVIRAEHPLKAVIAAPGSVGNNDPIIDLAARSHITIRGLVIDGQGRGRGVRIQGTGSAVTSGVVIEENLIRNIGAAGINFLATRDAIVRHNTFDTIGTAAASSGTGEVLYIGGSNDHIGTSLEARNIQVYGNTIRNGRNQAFDIRQSSRNVHIHHNIVEQHQDASIRDGIVNVTGPLSSFHDNIIRNVQNTSNYPLRVSGYSGNAIKDNVLHTLTKNSSLITQDHPWAQSLGYGAAEVSGNTLCNLNSYGAGGLTGVNFRSNPSSPQSQCTAEEQRILSEMQSLPSCRR